MSVGTPDAAVPQPLLVLEPDMAGAIPRAERETARRELLVAVRALDPGPLPDAPPGDLSRHAFALLIATGLVTADVLLEDRISSELLGPGDLVAPWRTGESFLPVLRRFTVAPDTTVAVLDERFLLAARRWPGLVAILQRRSSVQLERAWAHGAVRHLARVDTRLLALLWLLADRWGRMTPDGVVVPLHLTHEALGRLVGAQRSTVTLALGELLRDGTVTRRDDGSYALRPNSRRLLEARAAPPGALPARPLSRLQPRPRTPPEEGSDRVPIDRRRLEP